MEPTSSFTDQDGQYLDLQHPAPCTGNLTAWHFCFYTSSVVEGNLYSIYFRVWRPTNGNAWKHVHQYQLNLRAGGQSGSNTGLLVCENVALNPQEYFRVQQNDILGVYLPVLVNSLPIIAEDVRGSQLYYDTRQNFEPFTDDRVQRNNLREILLLALHLDADIGEAAVKCFL